jgi:non-heme chloroperoxidase
VLSDDLATVHPLERSGEPTAALVPGSRLVVFDGAGHGLYASEASRYNAEIVRFASALADGQSAGQGR